MMLFLKNLLKSTITVFFILYLSGCATPTKYADHTLKAVEFQEGNKAVVIMKGGFNLNSVLGFQSRLGYSIAKVDPNYPDLKTRHRYRAPI